MRLQCFLCFISRYSYQVLSVSRNGFHDKVVIEAEIKDLRQHHEEDWQTTKFHLKLAKRKISLNGYGIS